MPLTPRSPSAAAAPKGPAEPPGSPLVPTRAARPARWSRIARPLCGGCALLFLMGDDGISREEYLCEAAVLHLVGCCPDFPASELEATARTPEGLVMAIRHRRLPIAAVQFHPESILSFAGGFGLRLIENAIVTLAAERQAAAE